ncbi:DUF6064 family protein [Rubrivivax sp. RP6-9]|uniref:DUF6064 family protein n=1 Tax=Rubrivivax sp. RP6-9 TaxID=3415750 RepID=UPI003CC5F2E8
MTEWWTYRPSDFLMFAPATYWRLFELHNAALWPLQPVLLLALVTAAWWWRQHAAPLAAGAWGAVFAAAALAWAGVGWSFLLQRYAEINWAAQGAALAFGVQAAGLLVLACSAGGIGGADGARFAAAAPGGRRRLGLALLLAAVLLYPLLAPLQGRPWAQAELVALAPDPTAIGTLGLLLCVDSPHRGLRRALGALRVLPWAWCAASAATLWTMGAAQAVVPTAVLLAVALAPALPGARAVAHSRSTTSPHGD